MTAAISCAVGVFVSVPMLVVATVRLTAWVGGATPDSNAIGIAVTVGLLLGSTCAALAFDAVREVGK